MGELSAARRNDELARDLARKAIEAAERCKPDAGLPADLAGRLRDAAGADGRLTVTVAEIAGVLGVPVTDLLDGDRT